MENKPRKKFRSNNFDNFNNFDRPKKKFVKKAQPKGMEVIVYDDDVMKAWRILKRKLTNENVLQEIKDRRYYQKPSAKKREKRKEAVKNEYRRQIKNAQATGIPYKDYDPFKQSFKTKKKKR
jgi:small subunit ribosomal protein S21